MENIIPNKTMSLSGQDYFIILLLQSCINQYPREKHAYQMENLIPNKTMSLLGHNIYNKI